MSSSGAIERRSSDNLRKERKAADEREKQIQAQNDARIKRLQEKHAAQLRDIEERYEGNLETYRNKNTEMYSSQDAKHKREIEELKNTYRQDRKQASFDMDRKLNRLDDINKTNVDYNNKIQSEKLNYLNEKYGRNIKRNEEGFSNVIDRNREGYKDSMATQKRDQAEAHQKNKEHISGAHRDQMKDVQSSFKRSRDHAKNEKKSIIAGSNNRLKQVTDGHVRYVDDLKARSLDNSDYMRDQFRDSLDQQREDYNEELGRTRDRMFTGVRERQENEVEYLQGKVETLHRSNARDKIKTERDADRRVANIKKQGDKVAKHYSESQQRFINDVREENARNMSKDHAYYSERLTKAEMNYKDKLGMTENVLQEHYKEEMARLERAKNNDNARANLRIKLTEQTKNRELKRLVAQQQEQLRVLKQSNTNDRNKLAEQIRDEKRFELNKLHDMLSSSAHESESKVMDIKAEYQERIDDMANQKDRERRIMAETASRLARERQASSKNEVESLKAQYEGKIAKLKNNYNEQLNQMSDIHSEQMDQAYEHMRRKDSFQRKA